MEIDLELLKKHFHFVTINLNDTFYYASGDGENMDVDDLEFMYPLIQQYGDDASNAYTALIRGHDPQISKHITSDFKKCKDIILQKMKADEFFCLDHNEEILERLTKQAKER